MTWLCWALMANLAEPLYNAMVDTLNVDFVMELGVWPA